MTIQSFIEKSIEGGCRYSREDVQLYDGQVIGANYEKVLLDPEAWKAVGKVEGWKESDFFCSFGSEHPRLATQYAGRAYTMDTWQRHMQGMIDALAEGKSIEQYLETL